MYCKNCGMQYNQGEVTCRQCGSALENNVQQPQVVQQQTVNTYNNQPVINQPTPTIPNVQSANGVYRLTLTRPKNFVGSMVKFKVYIDNNEVGAIKNGETIVLNVSSGNHIISFNKTMQQNIQINGDTFADVGVIASNQFGIINIKDSNGNNAPNNTLNVNNAEKIIKSTKGPLIASSACIGITMILLFTAGMVISPVVYGILIGYTFINHNSVKQNKELLGEKYESANKTCIISFVVGGIGLLISLFLII